MRVKPSAHRFSANRYNRRVTTYGRISVVLLCALQCWASPALAQNQGIGGFAQAFEAGPEQDGAYPQYRIEILAFAYNGFDANEEIFPDESFEIVLDTRPPKHLIKPAPRDSELLAPDATLPTAAEVGGSEDNRSGNGAIEPAADQDVGMNSNLDGVTDAEPVPSDEPLGPADDGTLFSLLYESMTAGEEVLSGEEHYPVRTAYVQRLIASLQSLEDQSRVPLVFDPIPESPPLPGLDAGDSNPLGDDAIRPGAIDADGPEPASSTPRPRFRVLRSDELELRAASLRLQRDADYTPLAHGGWIQPAYPPELAIPVDISLLGTVNPVGTVQLHLSRFLHVTVDLVYRAPPVPPPLQSAPITDGVLSELNLPLRYALRTQRRVRSAEVNYLDHPAIGLLVIVRPQPVEPEDADDPLSPPRGPAA